MRLSKLVLILLFAPILAFSYSDKQVFQQIQKDLDSIIVKDLNKKQLIFQKDANQKLSPASLTKIMTSIIAIESGKMDKVVTITKEMKNVEPTIMNFKVGEKFYLRDLVNAAMIKSANDAANAIAIYLGNGNKQKFVNMMNAKAKKLGMLNTNFQNPCGFDAPTHKSTASDLLKLTEYAIKNKTFNTIVKKENYTFQAINTKRTYKMHTSNKLLPKEKYMVGVKTGYTSKAGPCLIARAKDGKKDILLVMLNSQNRWENTKLALDTVLKNR
ncbi:D-alanyl-D-alanine carboxypeptidase family protein [Aliarcobacter vitoriensis]|uniref:Peptidase S11 n=1 Tax=Aliarcobacter vitoriensis TaxID=2011099 RepID=A0A366MQJ3_9BACT|nr:serine hydrolase [Aliarcobacter vitoriensis]RBQ28551.1 peptidase S11 [Aliarcobacter vitoriensis]